MAFDESLAGRMRALLADEPDVSERRMFGGLAFMIDGNMAVVASSQGGLMVKVDAADAADLIASTRAYPAEMRGRPMRGWLRVDSVDLTTDAELAPWVRRGVSAVRAAPKVR